MSKCCWGVDPAGLDRIPKLSGKLTVVTTTGDVVWPHIPLLDGVTDSFVRCKVDYRDVRPTRFMSRHKVDMECHHIASCVHLDLVGVVFVLVTAALIQVALVICVGHLDRVLDRPG